jgi:AcrR family transcriptional regulator
MSDQHRPYLMTARAESQQATRRRITESAVALHGTLGPARTSMSAVAQHAGVERSTLYRHFPDEEALFAACTAHWLSAHPLPDIASWAAMRDPGERLRGALADLYAYYAGAEPMLVNILRDVDSMEVVQRQFAPFLDYLEAARTTLIAGRPRRGRAAARRCAAVGHAIAFTTWRSLVREQSCTAADAIDMMCLLADPH